MKIDGFRNIFNKGNANCKSIDNEKKYQVLKKIFLSIPLVHVFN